MGRIKAGLVSGVWVLMLFVALFGIVLNVTIVKADVTIYIRADGSIDPPTAPITSADNVTYTFIGNITDSIVVQRSNIIIDGKGYTLQGSGSGNGFYWTGINNVTVKNTNIKNFFYGVYMETSQHSKVTENTITNSNHYGVYFYQSDYDTVSGNTITNSNETGVCLGSSNNSVVFGNTITNNLYCSIYLVLSSNIVVSGNTITNSNDTGVYLAPSNNITVSGNTITNSTRFGVYLESNNNTVSGNTITNSGCGVYLEPSNNITVSGNTITNSTYYGVYLGSSNNNTVSGNTISNSSNSGIYFYSSNNSVVSGNSITYSSHHGVALYSSSNNKIYHNNFIGNPQQAYVSSDSLNNVWDDGYPSGGNYWDDYSTKHPNASEIDSSGIWNTTYAIDESNTDHYPLMNQYVIPEFPSFLVLPLLVMTTLLAVTVYKKKSRLSEI